MAAAASKKKNGPRVDPKRRHVQGISPWMTLKNRDPERVYVLAGVPGSEFGPEYFEALGYETEVRRPGGPHFAAGVTGKDGEPITYRGQHVLMSCSMEDYESRYEFGDGIAVGQAGYDQIMKQIGRSKPTREIIDSNLRPRDDVDVSVTAEHERIPDLEHG